MKATRAAGSTSKRAASQTAVKKPPKRTAHVMNEQHVVPLGNGWVVKTGNSKTFTVITDTKKEAVEIAKSIAKIKKSRLVVHGKFGIIEKRENYS